MHNQRGIDYDIIESNAEAHADFYSIRLLNGKYSDSLTGIVSIDPSVL